MKFLNSTEEPITETPAVTDFLDSLDTDITNPVEAEVVQEESENVDNVTTENAEENKEEVTALVVVKPNSLFVAQTMFKKSIKISIKSFLISLSLGFLNLFL